MNRLSIKSISNYLLRGIAFFLWKSGLYGLGRSLMAIRNNIESDILKFQSKSKGRFTIFRPYRVIGISHIKFKGNFTALSDLRLECFDNYNGIKFSPLLEIGNNVTFNQRCHVGCINHIRIGDNVLIGSNVLITDHSHGKSNDLDTPPEKRDLFSKGPVSIGDNTWICDDVCILPNVAIGVNCIIGAGCIVNKNIPDNCIAVGNPMRILQNSPIQ